MTRELIEKVLWLNVVVCLVSTSHIVSLIGLLIFWSLLEKLF